jgi:hypothetical protein
MVPGRGSRSGSSSEEGSGGNKGKEGGFHDSKQEKSGKENEQLVCLSKGKRNAKLCRVDCSFFYITTSLTYFCLTYAWPLYRPTR